ncbi:MAG: response regulator [Bradymonadaceae bacterium]|nr:response regulator [Lujinxingiaceae bacterium]
MSDDATKPLVQGAKEAELIELRRVEQRLARALDAISDAFICLDHGWRLRQVNRAAEQMLQSPMSALLGQVLWDVLPVVLGTNFERQCRRALESGEQASFEAQFVPLGLWVNAQLCPTEEGLEIYLRDMSAQREAERKRHESDERFRIVASATSDAIWDWDLKNDVLWRAKGKEDESEVSLSAWTQNVHPDDKDRFWSGLRSAIAGNGTHWSDEYRYRDLAGDNYVLVSRGFIMRDAQGVAYRVLGGTTDVTREREADRRLAEQAALLLQAERMEGIGTLAGGIAHDLNNILAPILLSMELLRMQDHDEVTRETLASVEAAAHRGADMVRQILTYARGTERVSGAVDVRQAILEIEKVLRDSLPKNIALTCAIEAEIWAVCCDATQLHRVLLNLSVNARDAMADGGTLHIKAENMCVASKRHVQISVSDSGLGMTPKVVRQIFDPFFTTKEIGSGTGLGLSTVDSIVRSHGGRINVDSTPGAGTTFKVLMPALDTEVPKRHRTKSKVEHGRGELVLLVDDDESIRLVTTQILEVYNYRVVSAVHGADALEVFARRGAEIAVVLTDMMMPVMDGPAAIRALKALRPELAIIATSGLSTAEHAFAAGADEFLPKPFNPPTLLAMLHRILNP